jgi:hypothetical protein
VDEVAVASYIPALVGATGPDLVRRHIAFYVGAMGSYYHRLMVRSGWQKQADEIRSLYQEGQRKEAAARIDDEMLRALAITGTADEARSALRVFRDSGVQLPILAIPQGADRAAIHATLEALGG